MLLLQNAFGEALSVIIIINRHNSLDNDRTGIYSFIGKVNGASGKFDPVIDSLLLDMEAREGGEERRVDIEYFHWKSLKKDGSQYSHESGHHNKLHPRGVENFNHSPVKILSGREKVMVDYGCGNIMFSAPFQGIGVLIVADYDAYPAVKPVIFNIFYQGLEIRSIPRNKNAKRYLSSAPPAFLIIG